MTLGNLAVDKFITIPEKTPLFEIVRRMRAQGANAAIVVSKEPLTSENILGVITKERIADLIEQSVASYEE